MSKKQTKNTPKTRPSWTQIVFVVISVLVILSMALSMAINF